MMTAMKPSGVRRLHEADAQLVGAVRPTVFVVIVDPTAALDRVEIPQAPFTERRSEQTPIL
jgi:hypothetical protein